MVSNAFITRLRLLLYRLELELFALPAGFPLTIGSGAQAMAWESRSAAGSLALPACSPEAAGLGTCSAAGSFALPIYSLAATSSEYVTTTSLVGSAVDGFAWPWPGVLSAGNLGFIESILVCVASTVERVLSQDLWYQPLLSYCKLAIVCGWRVYVVGLGWQMCC
jgi:hypothetical protein